MKSRMAFSKAMFCLLAFSLQFALISCTKCQTCNLTYNGGNISTTEVCNDDAGQTKAKTDCETIASVTPNTSCSCTMKHGF